MRTASRLIPRLLLSICLLVAAQTAHAAKKITIAVAADLKFALDEIVVLFNKSHPADQVEVIYGSSGKFRTQIEQGAPYGIYFLLTSPIRNMRHMASARHWLPWWAY